MSDVTAGGGPPDEPRDERVAELLAVEPLDPVTRRRLVKTAVASAPWRRPRLAVLVPVAAALMVGAVVGLVVVTHPDDSTPTAAPASSTSVAAAPAPRAPSAGGSNE